MRKHRIIIGNVVAVLFVCVRRYDALREGGELYFSDVYADRRYDYNYGAIFSTQRDPNLVEKATFLPNVFTKRFWYPIICVCI